eukprot:TRINITY_DN2218_c0_g1_i1.p1 TRINITY_DN2218_c0_g1~~TRINITY_DN2218_c0_g1_i1.p1  ORF type:complete len:435 (-),score=70.27 TRINITY_DN2218_c0_g1_i1:341-1645(-)
MVGIISTPNANKPAKDSASRMDHFWNPCSPKFYQHLVYGAGKPRCVLPLEALRAASRTDEGLIVRLRQRYTQAARDGPEGLMNLALFLLIVDNDLVGGGDLLKDAAKRFPSAQTLCQQARFLYNMKKEYTQAWQLFEKALQADPVHVDTIGYYAGFVASVERDYDRAEQLFLRCLAIAPDHANHLGGYARFLATVRGRFTEAEECFERSIAAAPNNVVNLNNYAAFLAEVQKDLDRAETLFRKAVHVDPSCGFAVRNLLNFLVWMRGDNNAAKELWNDGGAEALQSSLDETYHPDEINPAVREDMAAQARFLDRAKQQLQAQAHKAGAADFLGALPDDLTPCVLCSQSVGVCKVYRSCESEREGAACEGAPCSCKGVTWCVPCILQHYWHDTKGELKSFARCPNCRAEFCLHDIAVHRVSAVCDSDDESELMTQ